MEVGNIVTLNSGGPAMTIHQVGEDGSVQTIWHAEDGTLQHGTFQIDTLTEKDAPKAPAPAAPAKPAPTPPAKK